MAEYTITKSDFLAASWYIQRKSRLVLYVWALLVGALCALYVWKTTQSVGVAVVVCIATAVLGGSLRLHLNRRKAARVYDDHVASSPDVSLSVSADGVDLNRGDARIRIGWDQLKFWAENERFLMLYQGKDFAQIVVKDALSKDEDEMIRERLQPVKRI